MPPPAKTLQLYGFCATLIEDHISKDIMSTCFFVVDRFSNMVHFIVFYVNGVIL